MACNNLRTVVVLVHLNGHFTCFREDIHYL